jgi:hypothetical protein
VPATDGKRIAEVYRAGDVIAREDTDGEVILMVRMDPWKARHFGAT